MKNFPIKLAVILCSVCIVLAILFLSQYEGPKANSVVKNLELKK